MRLSDFKFELPDELIARYPADQRDASRLLHLNAAAEICDRQFSDIVDLVGSDDCLIFNNTKVIPARLLGSRESGGKVEILIERVLDECEFIAMVKASNSPKPGTLINVADYQFEVTGREGQFFKLSTLDRSVPVMTVLEQYGHMPLPPYIDRGDTAFDAERYQTVYAKESGAVAAPTAGLHFTEQVFEQLKRKSVAWDFVTLHVGSGTFAPVRVDKIDEHQMHSERFSVPESVVELVKTTRQRGGRVIAVGTTSVRCLESASLNGEIQATSGDTDIFIYPGYRFKAVDALITNFHLPESTLIMLVSALCGKDNILKAYQHAVNNRYRFFSYGDAMFLEPQFLDSQPESTADDSL